ncbi:unnamed protein product [Meloidogyne enterolobii]|uniref:Uncharacterized protein n=1 Tax=Meloidogyne enterolobii TaxID=390850 RepID=A0ACB0XWH8_MELEN
MYVENMGHLSSTWERTTDVRCKMGLPPPPGGVQGLPVYLHAPPRGVPWALPYLYGNG